MIGHAQAEKDFLDAWNSGRLAHAWLLTGPKGIGKATLAYRIARFVLAGGGDGGLFGGPPESLDIGAHHPVVHQVSAQGHRDLKVVERGYTDDKKTKLRGEIVIDDVRKIGDLFHQTADAGWRLVLIDAADEMNRNAANAVLKILEEPPAKALVIMVSHSPGRLLPTIRSRCRRLALNPLSADTIGQLLAQHRPDLTDTELTALAHLGEGSLGKAVALAAEGGLDLYRDLIGLLSALPRLDVPALHAFAERVGKSDADSAWRTVTELTTWWLARLVRAGGRQGKGMSEVVPGEAALMGRLLAAASLDRWLDLWEKTGALFARTDAVNLDRKQALLTAFLALERLSRA
nr:DNA polymerase III subunit delta' [Magnetospirillum sulfuroxidans]